MKFYTKVLILLFFSLFTVNAIASEDITGKWQGKLAPAPGNELIIQFIIKKADDGSYSVVLNSPDQGAIKDIKATSVKYESGKLTMDVTDLSGSYEGIFKDGKFEGNWKQEGTSIPLNLSPYKKPVLTEEDKKVLLGEWHGPLDIPQVSLTAVVRFEIKDNNFAGFFRVAEEGSNETPLTDIELDDGNLSFKLAGALQYKGKLTDNQIEGKLLRPGAPLGMTLKKGKFEAPAYTLNLPEENRKNLTGEWHGELKMPKNILHVKFKFETDKKGEFVGFYGLPDNNVKGIPFTEGNIVDGKIDLKIKVSNAEFKGEIKGDRFAGEWLQAGLSSIPLEMKKGEYVPPVFPLDLPDETRKLLSGGWHGQIKTFRGQKELYGSYNASFSFETNDNGEFIGFYNVPDLYSWNIPVTEASLEDGSLILKMQRGDNIEFKGKLAGDELTGQMTSQGANTPLSLKKGKYIPMVYSLDASKEDREFLSGDWVGEILADGKVIQKIFLVFETTEKGEFIGIQKYPGYSDNGFPIIGVNFSDGKPSITGIDAEFNFPQKGDAMTGEVIIISGQKFQFSIKKEKYTPQVYPLKLSEETMKDLSGTWKGKLGSYNLVFRFEKNKKGDFIGLIENTDTYQKGIPITDAGMSEGKLTMKIMNAALKGKLSKGSLECEWIQGAHNIPLALKKE